MKILLLVLFTLSLTSCSEQDEFYSIVGFNDQFTNGLFISKLTNNNIPFQFDYYMGEQYVLVHSSFKESLLKLRKDSLKESKSLALINLTSECSQKKLSQRFKESHIFHMTLSKRDTPMIRVTNKDHSSETVSIILNGYDWRCD